MSDKNAYYQHQTRARGLLCEADVKRLVDLMTPVYEQTILNWLPSQKNAAIYEAACGPGIMLRFLKMHGYTQIAGSDLSEGQIEFARMTGAAVKLADSVVELKGQPADQWDCVIAIDFMEHLDKPVLMEFYGECFRTLKPGGVLILRGPNGDSPLVGRNLYNDITHVWAYTSVATRALLGVAGFGRIEFADESIASIQKARWLKVPLARLSQVLLRGVVRAATRENIEYWGPSLFIAARKPA